MKKCSIIEDLLFSNKNRIAVEEQLAQFNELFKLLLSIHEDYSQKLDDDKRADEDDWFDDLDNTVCTFKRKIHSWLRIAKTKKKSSKRSSRSSESRQSKSSESHSSQRGTKSHLKKQSHLKSQFPPEMTLIKSQQNFQTCLISNFLFTPISNIYFKRFSR